VTLKPAGFTVEKTAATLPNLSSLTTKKKITET
jgi:hypothetical protein